MTLDTTKPFRLGFLTHVHGAGRAPAEVYRDLITVFQAAEDLGFDGGWVAQHHLRSDYGRLPSPPVLLAAVARADDPSPARHGGHRAAARAPAPARRGLVGTRGARRPTPAARSRNRRGQHRRVRRVRAVAPADRHADFDGRLGVLRDALAASHSERHRSSRSPPRPISPTGSGSRRRIRIGPGCGRSVRAGSCWGPRCTTRSPSRSHWPTPTSTSGAERRRPVHRRPRIAVTRAVFPARNRHAAAQRPRTSARDPPPGFAKHGYTELLDLSTEDYLARINVHYGSVDDVVGASRPTQRCSDYADWFLPVVQHEVSSLAEDIRRLEIIATRDRPGTRLVGLGWTRAGSRGMSRIAGTARPFKLGFLTHVHGDVPSPHLYQDVVELFVAAEELGFDSGWVAQHHFQPRFGRLPSPLVLLAAAASRTRRIRLGRRASSCSAWRTRSGSPRTPPCSTP